MKSTIPFPTLIACGAILALSSCNKESAPAEAGGGSSSAATHKEPPADAGTGNAEARGVQTGSGTRSDYKPTTGPGGVEETKQAPAPAR
jgi:hypothetical protein